jgi:Ran GTPase-activating protein (RanGAP) involved in mRNA processing and transport
MTGITHHTSHITSPITHHTKSNASTKHHTIVIMNDDDETKAQDMTMRVEANSLEGLRALAEGGLLNDGGDELCASWLQKTDERVAFNDSGKVTSLNLGGMRLRKGLPCVPVVFHNFEDLSSLNLGGTDLPIADIAEVLRYSVAIESLHLSGNGLGDDGAKQIAAWLETAKAKHLIKLDLRYNDIGGTGMEALCCQGLLHTNVAYWHMEGNHIGDDGCAALSKALLLPDFKLQELFLGANQIGADGAIHLAKALKNNNNSLLSKLYLEGNHIGHTGATAMAEALESLEGTATLKNLFMDNNNIGKEGSERLAKALNSATAIPDTIN